jgi:glycosyltransferase involved in cell wall biosynthesis
MEAAAMGLPVVATNIRGCREVVVPGVNGFLTPLGDVVALADALGRLVADPDERRAMGRASRKKAVAEFDQQRVIDITLETYTSLLARRSEPQPA